MNGKRTAFWLAGVLLTTWVPWGWGQEPPAAERPNFDEITGKEKGYGPVQPPQLNLVVTATLRSLSTKPFHDPKLRVKGATIERDGTIDTCVWDVEIQNESGAETGPLILKHAPSILTSEVANTEHPDAVNASLSWVRPPHRRVNIAAGDKLVFTTEPFELYHFREKRITQSVVRNAPDSVRESSIEETADGIAIALVAPTDEIHFEYYGPGEKTVACSRLKDRIFEDKIIRTRDTDPHRRAPDSGKPTIPPGRKWALDLSVVVTPRRIASGPVTEIEPVRTIGKRRQELSGIVETYVWDVEITNRGSTDADRLFLRHAHALVSTWKDDGKEMQRNQQPHATFERRLPRPVTIAAKGRFKFTTDPVKVYHLMRTDITAGDRKSKSKSTFDDALDGLGIALTDDLGTSFFEFFGPGKVTVDTNSRRDRPFIDKTHGHRSTVELIQIFGRKDSATR